MNRIAYLAGRAFAAGPCFRLTAQSSPSRSCPPVNAVPHQRPQTSDSRVFRERWPRWPVAGRCRRMIIDDATTNTNKARATAYVTTPRGPCIQRIVSRQRVACKSGLVPSCGGYARSGRGRHVLGRAMRYDWATHSSAGRESWCIRLRCRFDLALFSRFPGKSQAMAAGGGVASHRIDVRMRP
jgi:hypothetical protein